MTEEKKPEQQPAPETFSADYVRELREENAKWRGKVRDLEQRQTATEMKMELDKRGIKAEPEWVKLSAGQSVQEAIDSFVAAHPHLSGEVTPTVEVPAPQLPKSIPPTGQRNTNLPGKGPQGSYGGRSLEEIRQDPKARSALREHYRDLLRSSSNQKDSL